MAELQFLIFLRKVFIGINSHREKQVKILSKSGYTSISKGFYFSGIALTFTVYAKLLRLWHAYHEIDTATVNGTLDQTCLTITLLGLYQLVATMEL